MANERRFQKALAKAFRDKSFYVMEGANAPGHPDLTILGGYGQFTIIELKDLSDRSLEEKIFPAFKRAQVPWMLSFLKLGIGPMFIAIDRGEIIWLYKVQFTADAVALTEKTIGQILSKSMMFNDEAGVTTWIANTRHR